MKFLDAIKQRYTTKVYDPSKKVDSTIIEELKEILRLSPSSINSQPWRFIFVEEEESKAKFAEASLFNKEKVEGSSLLVIFQRFKSIEAFEEAIAENMIEGQINYYNTRIKSGSEESVLEWFSRQVYLALGVFLSGCAAIGVDSTPMEGIDTAKYDEIIGSEKYQTLFAVAVGYRDKSDWNLPEVSPKKRKERGEIIADC